MDNVTSTDVPLSMPSWSQASVKQLTDQAVKYLRTYVAPILLIVTAIGVAAVFYCAIKARGKLKGSHVILCTISAADFATVFFSLLLEDFLADGLKSFLPELNMPHHAYNWACKLWAFFWILSNSLSSNILCLMAADRVYALNWPLRHRARMTKSRYWLAVGGFILAFAAVSVHGVVLYDAYEYYGARYCYVILTVSPSIGFAVQIYTNLIMNGFLPGITLAALNLFICFRVWRIRNNPVRYAATSTTSTAAAATAQKPSNGQIRTSLTLIIMAAFYLIASVPRASIYFVMFLLNNGFMDSTTDADLLPLVFSLAKCLNYLFYLNCALNWVIYCARVPLFRKQLPMASISSSA